MARTKGSVIKKDDDRKKKKKDEKETNDKTPDSSDDEMFTKAEKDSGIPDFIKGTTWPSDTKVEVVVNYDAAKELRSVKKEFYPLLYHMTRADPRQMSNCICRSKILIAFVKARVESDEKRSNKYKISQQELRSLNLSNAKKTQDSPKKTRTAVIASNLSKAINDITDAKTEILKLLSRVSLRRQEFAKLLVWIQNLKLCGKAGAGRWGEVFVKDPSLSSTNTSSESEEETKPKQKSQVKGQEGQKAKKSSPKSNTSTTSKNQRWTVGLRKVTRKTTNKKPETDSDSESEQDSKSKASSQKKAVKLNKFTLQGKTLCKKETQKLQKQAANKNKLSKCVVPLVDVASVIEKDGVKNKKFTKVKEHDDKKVVSVIDKRLSDKNKAKEKNSKSGSKRCASRLSSRSKSFESVDSKYDDFIDDDDDLPDISPSKKSRCSPADGLDIPVPMYMYKVSESEDFSKPVIEIEDLEDGTCVPYEDRFVKKEDEVLHDQFPEPFTDTQEVQVRSFDNVRNANEQTRDINKNLRDHDREMPSATNPSEEMSQDVIERLSPPSLVPLPSTSHSTSQFESPEADRQNLNSPFPICSSPESVQSSNTPPLPLNLSNRDNFAIMSVAASLHLPNPQALKALLQKVKTSHTSGSSESAEDPESRLIFPADNMMPQPMTIKTEKNMFERFSGISSEPTSSTQEKDDCSNVKQEPVDFVVMKNLDSECIVLDSDSEKEEEEGNEENPVTNKSSIESQKEADPIIVIDDFDD